MASHTTDAGLGLSFTGQLGGGGGGGVWATGAGAGSCFLADLWARDLCGCCAVGVNRDAGGDEGDCAEFESAQRTMPARNAAGSITHCIAEREAERDCSEANVRMGVSSRGYARPAGPESKHPTALDYQWPSNAHRVFRASFVIGVIERRKFMETGSLAGFAFDEAGSTKSYETRCAEERKRK